MSSPLSFLTALRHAFCATAHHIGITFLFISCDKHRHSLDHNRQTRALATYRTWKPANIIHYFHHLFPLLAPLSFSGVETTLDLKAIHLGRFQNAAENPANSSPFITNTTLEATLSRYAPTPHLPATMTDFDVRQRLQTSTFGEGRQLMKWVNSLEVAERLGDPALAMAPVGTCIIRSAPWVIYPGVSMNVPAMTASIHLAERNELDTILSLAVKHPSYRKSSSRLPLPFGTFKKVSNY